MAEGRAMEELAERDCFSGLMGLELGLELGLEKAPVGFLALVDLGLRGGGADWAGWDPSEEAWSGSDIAFASSSSICRARMRARRGSSGLSTSEIEISARPWAIFLSSGEH